MSGIFVALSARLQDEFGLLDYFSDWRKLAAVKFWDEPGRPTIHALQNAINRSEVLVTGWDTPPLVEALRGWSPEKSPLRLIVHTGGSVKFLVPPEALRAGLLVSTANDALAESVAEFTLGAIIAARRGMFAAAARSRAAQPALPYESMHELPGSVVGIIGASAIGRRVMDLLRPLGVTLLLADPTVDAETAAALGARKVELLPLFRRADIVSLHAPVLPETLGMLRAEHFAAMRDGALFVNTARGRLVDPAALLAELQTGRISAVLDVTDPDEPLPPDSPFRTLENCVVLPHIGASTAETRARQGRYTSEAVLAYLEGRPVERLVPAGDWDKLA